MTQDEINKIETIFGYLEPLYNELDILKKMGEWHFLPEVIEEAKEWVESLKAEVTQ